MELHEIETFERKRLAELKTRLLEQESFIKDERHKLWQSETAPQETYTVWDRLEILSADILGYASQIARKGYTRQEPCEVINHLHKLSIFNVECIMKWYPTAAQEYPKIKQFFELLDYVRLLLIDYIQRYLLHQKVAAT